ncbi:MAG: hypothetical protein ACX939_13605, partial [Hyphococcus sp.]
EPEPELEAEPELEINLDPDPMLAPPAEAPEPLVIEPEPAATDDATTPAPEDEPIEQTPEEDAAEPLVSVEPEQDQSAGLEDVLGEPEAEGEDAAGDEEEEDEEPPQEDLFAEEAEVSGDDMFDVEPTFSGRRFMRPQVELPLGEAPATPGSSGVVAIFCPEEFDDEDKAEECAGRRELRSGWRPGDSGEDWSRATELLKGSRERGETAPSYGPAARALQRQRDEELIRSVTDPRRSQDSVNNLPDAGDDNIMRGVEGDRPDIGPAPFEPGWTRRDLPEGLSQDDIDEIREALEEAERNN